MKKLHLADLKDAPLTTARAIRRVAFAFPMLRPLAFLFDPAISRAVIAIGNCSARSLATFCRTPFRIGTLRPASRVSSTLPVPWRFLATAGGLIALIASGLIATTPLVHAQAPTVSASGQTAPVVSQGPPTGVDVSVPPQVPSKFVTNPILSLPSIFVR